MLKGVDNIVGVLTAASLRPSTASSSIRSCKSTGTVISSVISTNFINSGTQSGLFTKSSHNGVNIHVTIEKKNLVILRYEPIIGEKLKSSASSIISKIDAGIIITAGELSTIITIFPSSIAAVAVSGRSEYLNFGNGLIHLCVNIHSARLSIFIVSASTSIDCISFLILLRTLWSTESDI